VSANTDAAFVSGGLPGVSFPEVPGHVIAGHIEELGEGARDRGRQIGDRVAVGWFGGSCGHCTSCREGDFIVCRNLKVPGWAYDGGFAEKVIASVDALTRIPDAVSAGDAGPMACAGVAEALQSLGGAKVVLATAGNSEAITATVDGLAPRGELVVIGADTASLGVNPAQLLMGAYIVRGHPAGTSQDVEDTMAFIALHGIRPITEAVPLDRVDEAYQKMLAGKARSRSALMGSVKVDHLDLGSARRAYGVHKGM
jgi:D-arabinose 1-dehydrogenase-like Zn-dependent alcohol dehydrogenase